MATAKTASCFQGGVRFQDGSLQATAAFGTVTSVAMTGDGVIFNASVTGSPITVSGTLIPSLKTQTAKFVLIGPTSGGAATPTFRALVAGDIPALAYVTSISLTAPAEITVGGSPITSSGTLALTWTNETANFVFAGPTTGAAATPTFRALVAADIAGLVSTSWSSLTAAAADLTLANAAFNSTFNQTSAVTWKFANTTAATSSVSQSSPFIKIAGRYWSGSDAEDFWTLQNVVANGTNGTSILDLVHSGTSGNAFVRIPAGTLATASAWGLNFTGTTVGFNASGSTIGIVTTSTYPTVRFYNGTTIKGQINTFTSSSIEAFSLLGASATGCITVESTLTTTLTQAGITLANVSNFAGTGAGTQYGVAVGNPAAGVVTNSTITFAPASGAANFVALIVRPVINQTGTSSGNYTGLLVNAVETALKGSANLLLDLQAGTTGGTSQFAINNAGKVTKYNAITTISQGMPAEYATVDLTAQSAAIAATTIYAVPASGAGMYRITWSATITTAATTSSVLGGAGGFQAVYTSSTDSVVKTTVVDASTTSAGNTTATAVGGTMVVYAKASTNIQYSFGYTSVGGTAMVYELHIKVEAM